MIWETYFVFGVLAAAVALFASDRVRLDLVALLVLLSLLVSGILTVDQSLAGFSQSVVLMVAGLFVVGDGLVKTGIAHRLGDWLMRVGGTSEARVIALLMAVVALVGAFMSSTGIVAIFIPVGLSIAARSGIDPSRIMMPLAYGALISGMMSLISTPPNLVASEALKDAGLAPFGFFDFTPIGLIVMVLGIGYMLAVGPRLLQPRDTGRRAAPARQTMRELADAYGVYDRVHRFGLRPGSPLIGRTLAETELRTEYGIIVAAVERMGRGAPRIIPALPRTLFQAGDRLYAFASQVRAEAFMQAQKVEEVPIDEAASRRMAQEGGLAEVLIPPESRLIGKTLREAALRSRHRLSVVAIRRRGKPLEDEVAAEPLAFGDTLLVSGTWKHIAALRTDPQDFAVLSLPAEIADVAPAHRRAPWALGILAAMVLAMVTGVVPNTAAVLLAAVGMVVTGCVTMEEGYKSVSWQTLVLIAGMLPLATALDVTGGTRLMSDGLVDALGGAGPYAMMAGLFVLTALLGSFMSNTATAVLLAPVAIATAQDLGVSPYTFAMTVAIAASAAFSTPVSSPVVTLVVEPGNYRFMDFVKIGVPMTVLVMAVTLLVLPLLFPL